MSNNNAQTGHYYCANCAKPIVGGDVERRHTTSTGDDCHADCCTDCDTQQDNNSATLDRSAQ